MGEMMPNYWAVLPASVRYSRELSSTAKLLYAEITSLANMKGYCYAGNAYFANVFGVSESTVAHTISDMAKKGFFNVVLIYGTNKEIRERRIYIIDEQLYKKPIFSKGGIAKNCIENSPCKNLQGDISMQNFAEDYLCKNLQGGIAKNCIENNKNLNNNNNTVRAASADCGKTVEKSRAFQKPTVAEIREYCAQRRNGIDPQYFFDYYESKGWVVGKSRMKDWRASVRTWERNSAQYGTGRTGATSQNYSQETEEARDYERCPRCGKTLLWWSDKRQRYGCDGCGASMTFAEKKGAC